MEYQVVLSNSENPNARHFVFESDSPLSRDDIAKRCLIELADEIKGRLLPDSLRRDTSRNESTLLAYGYSIESIERRNSGSQC